MSKHSDKRCLLSNIDELRAKRLCRPNTQLDRSNLDKTESAADPLTVRAWGEQWLGFREAEGIRSVGDDRRIWRTHVLSEAWADWPIERVTRREAQAWWLGMATKGSSNPTHTSEARRSRPLAATTLANVRQTVRRCFADALDAGHVPTNPFASLRISRARRARTRNVGFPVLYPSEQQTALALFSGRERLLMTFALYTGLRMQEQWALRIEDVDLTSSSPSIVVRFGSVGLLRPREALICEALDGAYFFPTKGGRPRRIYLNEPARAALHTWMMQLSSFAPVNPHRLVFPRADGKPRRKGRVFRGFSRIARAIGRPFTWHGLRHSCASALLGGWWGERHELRLVCEVLGHSSVTVTERYTHARTWRRTRSARPRGRRQDFSQLRDRTKHLVG